MYQITAQCLFYRSLPKFLNRFCSLGYSHFLHSSQFGFRIEIKITSGVPQGSIIAPLLFLVFVNYLPSKCENLFPLMFADDAKFISIGTEPNLVQKDLNALLKWTETNYMPFKMDKCAHVSINSNENNFYFGNHVIEKKLTQSDLGLILSSDLKCDQHIEKACKKAIKIFFMSKRNVSNIYWTTKLNLYKLMIVPILVYGSPCYGLSKNIMV